MTQGYFYGYYVSDFKKHYTFFSKLCQVNLSLLLICQCWSMFCFPSNLTIFSRQIRGLFKRLPYVRNLNFGHTSIFTESAGSSSTWRTIRLTLNRPALCAYRSKAGWITGVHRVLLSGCRPAASEMHRTAIVADKHITYVQD